MSAVKITERPVRGVCVVSAPAPAGAEPGGSAGAAAADDAAAGAANAGPADVAAGAATTSPPASVVAAAGAEEAAADAADLSEAVQAVARTASTAATPHAAIVRELLRWRMMTSRRPVSSGTDQIAAPANRFHPKITIGPQSAKVSR
jgi:hypothetical protein